MTKWAIEYLDANGLPHNPRRWAQNYYSHCGMYSTDDPTKIKGHEKPEGAHEEFDRYPEKEWPRLQVAALPAPGRKI